jgi:hypothetical protein
MPFPDSRNTQTLHTYPQYSFPQVIQALYYDSKQATLVSAEDRLRAAGVLRSDGSVDYSAAIEILRRSLQDPYLKSLLLKFVAEHFREDLRKLMSISVYGIRLQWDEGFERFLRERKRRRRVSTDEMVRKYRNYFSRFLEGREFTEDLVFEVARHPLAGPGTSSGTTCSTCSTGGSSLQRSSAG